MRRNHTTVHSFSIMSKAQKGVFLLLALSAAYFLIQYAVWWFHASHIPNNFPLSPFHAIDITLFAVLSFVVFVGALLRFSTWFAIWHMKKPVHITPQSGLRVAFLTCYVPGKEPLEMLEATLIAMRDVEYPHDTWVLDEGNSDEVKALCYRLGVKHFSRNGIKKYNQTEGLYRTKTKAGNHNAWRDVHEKDYDIVAQVDMDHVPEKDYFTKTLGYFRDPKVAIVGMPQMYKNTDNWIAKGAAEQSYFFQGPMQQGFFGCDMPFLIGTSHIIRTAAMNQIGGYAPTIVEDHLTGMHFYANGWKGVFVPEILAQGEGPFTWKSYFSQQLRWSYGLFEILFNHTPFIFHKLSWKHKFNYLASQLYYFSGVSVFLGMILTILYLAFGIRSANMEIYEWLFYAIPPFVLTYAVQIFAHKFSIDPKNEPVFGVLGMFLQLGANLIYTKAFFMFIFGRKLQYAVTEKNKSALYSASYSVFTFHMFMILVLSWALIVSFQANNTALQLRFWALFNILTLSAVVVSEYLTVLHAQWKLVQATFANPLIRYNVMLGLTACFIIVFTQLVIPQPQLVEAFFSQPKKIETPLSGKILPLPKPFVGIAIDGKYAEVEKVETEVKRSFAVVNYYQSWGSEKNHFSDLQLHAASRDGKTVMVSWEPWEPVAGYARVASDVDQPAYRMANITQGNFDEYIRSYAKEVKAYKKSVFIRFAHEMNGNWYPWGSHLNTPEEYVAAWQHIHDIFENEGATNVTWVWAPNEEYEGTQYSNDVLAFYPGDAYVDWVGLSSFNWAGMYKNNVWRSPQVMFDDTITTLSSLHKPILIAETASAETLTPSAKAIWIASLAQYVKKNALVKGVIWFNVQDGIINWKITSSKRSVLAFHNAFNESFANTLSSEIAKENKKENQQMTLDQLLPTSFVAVTATRYF